MVGTQGETLRGVLDRVREARSGRTPVVVFDLDDTLFDVGPRTHAILRHLAQKHARRRPSMLEKVLALSPRDLPFDHEAALRACTGSEASARELTGEFKALFFSSKYLDRDVPMPGARDFVEACLAGGATIVYLTGRDRAGMHAGTIASLRFHGFPLEHPRVHLLMKPDTTTRDVDFKARSMRLVRRGDVVALFDNEPGNVNNFKEAFPQCTSILVMTKHSPDPPPVRDDVERVSNFVLDSPA